MMIWKRRVGDCIALGDEAVVVVKKVDRSDGKRFSGTVSLGFEVPRDMLVQRAETYVKQGEPPPFPQFFRVVNKELGTIYGYSFSPPAEGSTLSYGYRSELIAGYDDMTEDDHKLAIYRFRSEAEAEACVLGVSATDKNSISLGTVVHKFCGQWLVLLDYYRDHQEDVNPVIRSFIHPNPRVEEAIENIQRRQAG
jgi:sRNA-binding carbon storage regulator CsrA